MVKKVIKNNIALATAITLGVTFTVAGKSTSALVTDNPDAGTITADGTITVGTVTVGTVTVGSATYYIPPTSTSTETEPGTTSPKAAIINPQEYYNLRDQIHVSIDKHIATQNGTSTVTITKANWSQLSLGDKVTLTYKNQDKEFTADLTKDSNGQFTGTITVPSDATEGIYVVSGIKITSGDTTVYDSATSVSRTNILPEASILVMNAKPKVGTGTATGTATKKYAPVIDNDDQEDVSKDATITPDFNQGTATISTVDGKDFKGDETKVIGKHKVVIVATGIDGTQTSKEIVVNVKGEITDTTTATSVANDISNSTGTDITIDLQNTGNKVDKNIILAIKNKGRAVTFEQKNGVKWTFKGEDIKDDTNIKDLDLTVNTDDVNNTGIKAKVSKLTNDAQIIQFAENGTLPVAASVTVNVGADNKLIGKSLTLYYYNETTDKVQKVEDGVTVGTDGNVTITVAHNSDYFLSANSSLDSIAAATDTATATGSTTTGAKTGDYSNGMIVLALMGLAGASIIFTRKKYFGNN